MQLDLPAEEIQLYTSASQKARVATEAWGERNLFCPSCPSNRLSPSTANTPCVDFVCDGCRLTFQLKSQGKPLGRRLAGSAFSQMKRFITEQRAPHLFVLHYDPRSWTVRNLIFVPSFALTLSVIECRRPLG